MSGIEDFLNTFNEMGIVRKTVVGCCAVFLVLMIISVLGHAILGIPLDSFTEETTTKYMDFVDLDLNGDGGLSFDEVKYYDHNSEFTVSDADLEEIFDRSDRNDNGLLIGGEYDYYVYENGGWSYTVYDEESEDWVTVNENTPGAVQETYVPGYVPSSSRQESCCRAP